MTGPAAERMARAALTCVAEPGDEAMGALLRVRTAAEIIAALTAGRTPVASARPGSAASAGPGGNDGGYEIPGLERALRRWAARLGDVPPERTLDAWRLGGIRLVIPGDPEWPGQLDVLGDARPWGLWVRGDTDLRYACLRSVSVVGTRAATAYGAHVCTELAMALAESGWTVVSGGAYVTKTQLRATPVTGALPAACQVDGSCHSG